MEAGAQATVPIRLDRCGLAGVALAVFVEPSLVRAIQVLLQLQSDRALRRCVGTVGETTQGLLGLG